MSDICFGEILCKKSRQSKKFNFYEYYEKYRKILMENGYHILECKGETKTPGSYVWFSSWSAKKKPKILGRKTDW